MAIKGRRATYEERVSACEALEKGVSVDEIAEVLKVSRSSIFDWQKTYRAHGADALRTKKTRGPKSKLSDGQLSQLYRLIVGNDPRQLSFGLALWTRGMIQELIFRQFGVRLSLVSVGAVLANLGLSPQRPLYRSYERSYSAGVSVLSAVQRACLVRRGDTLRLVVDCRAVMAMIACCGRCARCSLGGGAVGAASC